jgi:pSer/pThr/pTyr-binding forkhead associated (FHA) protein
MKISLTYQNQTTIVDVAKPEIIVGRPHPEGRPDIDLVSDPTVSRRHARLYQRDGNWWIEDTGSRYGTFVNGVKLEYRRQLRPNDAIRIGETTLRLGVEEEEMPTVKGVVEDEIPTIKTLKTGPSRDAG